MRRLARLGRRQAAGLLAMVVLGLGVAVAAIAGQSAVALALLAVLLSAVLAGVVLLGRRIGGLHRAHQASIQDLRAVVEQLQRRVVAAVEKERLTAGDRHLELIEALARAERLAGRGPDLLRDQHRQIAALVQVFQVVAPRAPMPAADAEPADLLGLLHIVRRRQPGLVVALGVGPLTVWLGYAVEKTGGRLVAVGDDRATVERTRDMLLAHGLTAVETVYAPATDLSVDGRTVGWYEVDALDALHDIDLLVVGGPASALAPALHVLGRRLAPGAAVVVDERPGAGVAADETPGHDGRVAPRQGGFETLTPEPRLAGRYTALSYTPKAATVRS
jgi:predicted O-methyltransferase YrrM